MLGNALLNCRAKGCQSGTAWKAKLHRNQYLFVLETISTKNSWLRQTHYLQYQSPIGPPLGTPFKNVCNKDAEKSSK